MSERIFFAFLAVCAFAAAAYMSRVTYRSWKRIRRINKLNAIIHSTLYTSEQRSAATDELMSMLFSNHERPG